MLALCRRESRDDLYVDPRRAPLGDVTDDDVLAVAETVLYGQRPVPSLGGGPGYGAEADDVYSLDADELRAWEADHGLAVPTLDVGIAHGEKARGGALG